MNQQATKESIDAAAKREREDYGIRKLVDERFKIRKRLAEVDEILAAHGVKVIEGDGGDAWERT